MVPYSYDSGRASRLQESADIEPVTVAEAPLRRAPAPAPAMRNLLLRLLSPPTRTRSSVPDPTKITLLLKSDDPLTIDHPVGQCLHGRLFRTLKIGMVLVKTATRHASTTDLNDNTLADQ